MLLCICFYVLVVNKFSWLRPQELTSHVYPADLQKVKVDLKTGKSDVRYKQLWMQLIFCWNFYCLFTVFSAAKWHTGIQFTLRTLMRSVCLDREEWLLDTVIREKCVSVANASVVFPYLTPSSFTSQCMKGYHLHLISQLQKHLVHLFVTEMCKCFCWYCDQQRCWKTGKLWPLTLI